MKFMSFLKFPKKKIISNIYLASALGFIGSNIVADEVPIQGNLLLENIPPQQISYQTGTDINKFEKENPSQKTFNFEGKDKSFSSILIERTERQFENKFENPQNFLNNAFIFAGKSNVEVQLSPLEYQTKRAMGALQSAAKESLRSYFGNIIKAGGFWREVIEGRFDSYSISSPFNTDQEGKPGLVYNEKSKNHFKVNIWSTNPSLLYKHNFGNEFQFNLRTDLNGAEATLVMENIFPSTSLILGARINDYSPDKTSIYTGLNYSRYTNQFLQIGIGAAGYKNQANGENKFDILISAAYTVKF